MTVIGLNGWQRIEYSGKEKILHFTFELGRSRKTSLFFIPLSPAQVEALKKYRKKWPQKNNPSFVRVLHDASSNRLEWTGMYPFGYGETKTRTQMLQAAPIQMGIGSRVHHAVTEYLAKQFPRHTISHSVVIAPGRISQLSAMGIEHNHIYSIEEYLDIVRRHMEKKGLK